VPKVGPGYDPNVHWLANTPCGYALKARQCRVCQMLFTPAHGEQTECEGCMKTYPVRICQDCQKEFTPTRPRMKRCHECSKIWSRVRYRARPAPPLGNMPDGTPAKAEPKPAAKAPRARDALPDITLRMDPMGDSVIVEVGVQAIRISGEKLTIHLME